MSSQRALSTGAICAAFLGLVLLGSAVFFAPAAVRANGTPAHQTLPDDVAALTHLLNNAYVIELEAEACGTRVAPPPLKALCDNIHVDQLIQVRNLQVSLYLLTGQRPWNPEVTAEDQAKINQLFFGSYDNAGDFAVAAIDSMLLKYNDSDAVSSLCGNRGFTELARHFSATNNAINAFQANYIEDYKTLHYSDIPSNVAPVHKLHP